MGRDGRLRRLEARHAADRTELRAVRRALKLQATEYERRLAGLNHEHQRVVDVQSQSVTADKFEDYKDTQETALDLALELVNGRLAGLENWKAKATGIGLVLVLVSGTIGAAVMRALGG